jgi:hypothetical protein
MHHYLVVERWAEHGLCMLRCGAGRYHVARALSVMPPPGEPLSGDAPRLGFGLLVCAATGQIFRVIFEAVGLARRPPRPAGSRSASA